MSGALGEWIGADAASRLVQWVASAEWPWLAAVALAVYFFPFLVALRRRHHSVAAVFALNLLLGWTFVFWALALVWALSNAWLAAPPRRRRRRGRAR